MKHRWGCCEMLRGKGKGIYLTIYRAWVTPMAIGNEKYSIRQIPYILNSINIVLSIPLLILLLQNPITELGEPTISNGEQRQGQSKWLYKLTV